MTCPPNERKEMGTLALADFRIHPIWGGYEDDHGDSWVAPIDLLETVNEEDWDMFFVYCELRLADGTQMEGAMSITTLDHFVYGVRFFCGENKCHFPGIELRDRNRAIERLERWLGKNLSQISPVTFLTPYRWRDGVAVAGTIDLMEWGVFF